jgi:hypothetical protein
VRNLNLRVLCIEICLSSRRTVRLGSAAAGLPGLRIRIPPGNGYLSLVVVLCCQVEVSALG